MLAATPTPPPVLVIKNVSRHWQVSPEGKITLVKSHCSKAATDSQKAVFFMSSNKVPGSWLQHRMEQLEQWLTAFRGHPEPSVLLSQGSKECNLEKGGNKIFHRKEKEGIASSNCSCE